MAEARCSDYRLDAADLQAYLRKTFENDTITVQVRQLVHHSDISCNYMADCDFGSVRKRALYFQSP